MSEITKIAEKAADEIYGHVSTDGFGGIDFGRKEIVKIIEEAASAAIEAYEAAKTRDLLAGILTHEISADGVVNYVERDKMMGDARLHNKWLNDVVNRLAERKP